LDRDLGGPQNLSESSGNENWPLSPQMFSSSLVIIQAELLFLISVEILYPALQLAMT
jgi:hypothetical protein